MIELTDRQWQELSGTEQPPVVIDPTTGQQYRLIRQEIYERVCAALRPLGRNWDKPADDDFIRKEA
jgi:hypothetical protein